MGVAALVVMAVAAVASTAMSYQASQAQQKAANNSMALQQKSLEAQTEANNVSAANAKNQEIADRRRIIRSARVRQASILQSAENSGDTNSSGALGAFGAVDTNLGSSLAQSSSNSLAAQGISTLNNTAASYNMQASNAQTMGSIKASQFNAFSNIFSSIGSFAGTAAQYGNKMGGSNFESYTGSSTTYKTDFNGNQIYNRGL